MPPVLAVVVLLIGPIVLITLYRLGLRSNIPGTATGLDLTNWKDFLTGAGEPVPAQFFHSLEITLLVSIAATVAAYPLAYFLSFVARKQRYPLLLLLLAPFFTSYLLRVIAWQMILNDNGVVNSFIQAIGLRAARARRCPGSSTRTSPSSWCCSTAGSRSWRCRCSRCWRTWTGGCWRPLRTWVPVASPRSCGSRCR